jgi:hypothetical protein
MVNSNNVAPSVYDTAFKAANMNTLAFAPSSASLTLSQWPTMGSLIDAGNRLVVFMDANADFTSVPYIIDGTRVSSRLNARLKNNVLGLNRIFERMGNCV